MIPIGQQCKICKKIHLIKSIEVWDNLTPRERAKAYQTEHRCFRDGYFKSIDKESETWEFYLPLTLWKAGLYYVKQIKEEMPISEKYAIETYSYYFDED